MAQGTEAGGHGGSRATLPLVPAVVDAVAPVPVVAAGGIADGRGLAAALMLGAAGAMIGTRFHATEESIGHDRAKARIVAAQGNETQRTRIFDIARQHAWPQPWTGRALYNHFLERWQGREAELEAAMEREGPAFQAAQKAGDFDTVMVWAGEAVDLVDGVEPAGASLRRIGAEAEVRLRAAAALLG